MATPTRTGGARSNSLLSTEQIEATMTNRRCGVRWRSRRRKGGLFAEALLRDWFITGQQLSDSWQVHYNGETNPGGAAMGRSRSFNRFHRQLARQKRHSIRSLIPRIRDGDNPAEQTVDHTKVILDRVSGREVIDELLEREA